ncbi:hypothetical protein [Arthrobacter sp. CJ23]|uniref:hypothetical protein n=1 Tax=Arthrobacter sp. CJ23 TaxID=2972479 RepID=UPI00215D4098|nr:hypothetical protein [Arthrobacter sp. CJ23]UVJ39696.1 hypothetical protein NVV90_00385 [Arthrobacter sp. CJ23]
MEPMMIFLDEGALDGEARFPSACAVVVGDVAVMTKQIEDLIHELMLQPDFQLERGAADFEKVGFHHVEDNVMAMTRFEGLLPRMDFEWWCSADLDASVEDPYLALPDQFRWISRTILQKYRGRRVHFVFEQNDRLRSHFSSIVESAVAYAEQPSDLVTFAVGTKADRVLSVADYCIALASQAIRVWIDACCDTRALPGKYQYRSFAAIEPLCSTLFAANFGKSLSSRAVRLADHSFFDISGSHSRTCRRMGAQ